MATFIITVDDLPAAIQSADLIDVMLAGANATAARVAPCLVATDPAPTDDQLAEAQLVLVGAVARWVQAGSGAVQTEAAGPFSVTTDTRQVGGYRLWPSEIVRLQQICRTNASKAYSVDTMPASAGASCGYLGGSASAWAEC